MDQQELQDNDDQVESYNISEFLQRDYYEKFKLGQNLYDPSITLSRLSFGDKTSEDYNNTTHVGMIQIQERLTEEIHKSKSLTKIDQLLENKVAQLTQELKSSIEHTTILQKQNENYSDMIKEMSSKLQKQIRNNEIEKLLNQQLNKKIAELQEVNNNCKQQLLLLSQDKQSYKKNNISHPKSNQSMCSSNRNKERMTEDSTVKDSSVSEQRSHENARFIESAQQFYKTQNFWSPQQHVSPKASNLERRIESTLAQIRSIKLQIQQYNQK